MIIDDTINPSDYHGFGIDQDSLKKNYKPNKVIDLYGQEAAYIYDLENLIEK